jgi:hypothetical protein
MAAPGLASPWHSQLGSGLVGKQQLFQGRPSCKLKASPLSDRHQDGRLGATLGHHLRAIGKARIKELAEPGFGVLNGPSMHKTLQMTSFLTSLPFC